MKLEDLHMRILEGLSGNIDTSYQRKGE